MKKLRSLAAGLALLLALCLLPSALAEGELFGDINVDGNLTTMDVVFLQQYLAMLRTPSSQGLLNADLDGRTGVNMGDLATLRQAMMGDHVTLLAPGVYDGLADDPVRTTSATLNVSGAVGTAGDTVTVDVSLSGNPGLSALAFFLSYDTDSLEAVSYSWDPADSYEGALEFNADYNSSGKAYISFVSSTGRNVTNESGKLCTVSFQIKATANPGSYPITAELIDASYLGTRVDSSGDALQFPTSVSIGQAGSVGVSGAPVITAQPNHQVADLGETATFSVTAAALPAPTYQWQVSTDNGTSWNSVSDGAGGTTSSYTTPAMTAAMHGYMYRCVLSNSLGDVASSAVLLTRPGYTMDFSRDFPVDWHIPGHDYSRQDDSGAGWAWDSDDKTLTLNGLNFTTLTQVALKLPDGATVIVLGDNYLTVEYNGMLPISVIFLSDPNSSVEFEGGGSLTATAIGGAEDSVYALNVNGPVTFSEGDFTFTTRNATAGVTSTGISATGDITVNSGSVSAIGGASARNSRGISQASGSLYVEGGSLYATGRAAAVRSASINADGMFVAGSAASYADSATLTAAAAKVLSGYTAVHMGADGAGDEAKTARIATPTAAAFSALSANGSATATTTELTLTFDRDIEGLTAADVTVTGATKGALTKVAGETGVYTLAISSITVADGGNVTATVARGGYIFTPTNRSVPVRVHVQPDNVPDTGDGAALLPWLSLALISGAALMLSARSRKARRAS